jgi:metal-responsive CopG/Arc/MetJ family transcriptional regulator
MVIPDAILNGRRNSTMPTVKTAISLPGPLFRRAENVAHELQISRSQLVATAIDEFVKRYERRALIEAINRAYEEDPPSAEEKELLQGIREKQRKLLESDG